jgi:predicted RNase H-like HicB family nuclease
MNSPQKLILLSAVMLGAAALSAASKPDFTGTWKLNLESIPGSRPKDTGVYTETGRPEMNRYTVLFEQTATGCSAHVPDLPGCIAAGATLDETRQLIREAIEFHLEGMRLHGEAIPLPTTRGEEVEVPA